MDESIKEALELVKAQATVREMTAEEIIAMTQSIADWLRGHESQTQGGKAEANPPLDISPEASIKESHIVCLECGKKFNRLLRQHLAKHGLTHQEYRRKWGFKESQPLVPMDMSSRLSKGQRTSKSTRRKRRRRISTNR